MEIEEDLLQKRPAKLMGYCEQAKMCVNFGGIILIAEQKMDGIYGRHSSTVVTLERCSV